MNHLTLITLLFLSAGSLSAGYGESGSTECSKIAQLDRSFDGKIEEKKEGNEKASSVLSE